MQSREPTVSHGRPTESETAQSGLMHVFYAMEYVVLVLIVQPHESVLG